MKTVQILIEGDVHGVGFRYGARRKARELDLVGFVKNTEDGKVYVEATGAEENLYKFIEWCKVGPTFSKIEKVEINFLDKDLNYDNFIIEH